MDLSILTGSETPFWYKILVDCSAGVLAVFAGMKTLAELEQMREQKTKEQEQHANQLKQTHAEMRRDQCSRGMAMIEELLASNDGDQEYYAWDAMKMLDYRDARRVASAQLNKDGTISGYRTKKIAGESYLVNEGVIREALQIGEGGETPVSRYVRECFDELYFRMGQFNDAIRAGLVTIHDVESPLDYYVEKMAEDAEMHFRYLSEYRYEKTLRFLEHFDSWKSKRPRN
jgi:hypothetical protein